MTTIITHIERSLLGIQFHGAGLWKETHRDRHVSINSAREHILQIAPHQVDVKVTQQLTDFENIVHLLTILQMNFKQSGSCVCAVLYLVRYSSAIGLGGRCSDVHTDCKDENKWKNKKRGLVSSSSSSFQLANDQTSHQHLAPWLRATHAPSSALVFQCSCIFLTVLLICIITQRSKENITAYKGECRGPLNYDVIQPRL